MLNTIKIVQHNVLSWTFNRRNELSNYYLTLDPHIILLNSTGSLLEDKIKIFNYHVFQRNDANERNAGIAIAVRRDIQL